MNIVTCDRRRGSQLQRDDVALILLNMFLTLVMRLLIQNLTSYEGLLLKVCFGIRFLSLGKKQFDADLKSPPKDTQRENFISSFLLSTTVCNNSSTRNHSVRQSCC